MIKSIFSLSFFIFAALALVIGTAVYLLFGLNGISDSIVADIPLILRIIPNVGASVLIGAFLQELMPANLLSRYVGEESGTRGVAISAVAGSLTPGGPMTSFALVTALRSGGTGVSQLIAYMTSWSTMGMQRVVAWELPLMGPGFTLLRVVSSLPLPFIAAFIARRLSIDATAPLPVKKAEKP